MPWLDARHCASYRAAPAGSRGNAFVCDFGELCVLVSLTYKRDAEPPDPGLMDHAAPGGGEEAEGGDTLYFGGRVTGVPQRARSGVRCNLGL